ncbi:MAG: hypothetical protein V1492_06485 [Candidatus Micrarchaeota archaeon]
MSIVYSHKLHLKQQTCEPHRLRKKAGIAVAVLVAGLLTTSCVTEKSACHQLYDQNTNKVISVTCEFRLWKGKNVEYNRLNETIYSHTIIHVAGVTASGIDVECINFKRSFVVKSEHEAETKNVESRFELRLNYDGTGKVRTNKADGEATVDPLQLLKSFIGAKSITVEPTENPQEARLTVIMN